MRKNLTLALAVAVLLGTAPAHAAFVTTDTSAPAQASMTPTASNQFQSQLNALGLTSFLTSASLGLDAAGSIAMSYWGKEAAFRNEFRWAGSPVFTTGGSGVEAWGGSSNTVVSRSAGPGVLDFSFCALDVSRCLTNAQNDAQGMNTTTNIGIFVTPDRNTAWLLWDDGSGPSDDNDYDDMVVRLNVSPQLPEPATLGLLGLGLLGAGFAGRKRRR